MASLLLFACVMSLMLKMKGVACGLCHEGCNILFRLCVYCVAKMLHLSDTNTDNARLSCCWICQICPWIHFVFSQLPWWPIIIVFCMFPFCSWKYSRLRPAWLTNTIIACQCWACQRTTGVCLLTRAQHAVRVNDMNGKIVVLYCVR